MARSRKSSALAGNVLELIAPRAAASPAGAPANTTAPADAPATSAARRRVGTIATPYQRADGVPVRQLSCSLPVELIDRLELAALQSRRKLRDVLAEVIAGALPPTAAAATAEPEPAPKPRAKRKAKRK